MKSPITAVACLLAVGLVGEVSAQSCPVGTTQVDAQSVVAGNTLCAASGSDQWQEFHSGGPGGTLIDYKKGPSDAVDRTATVGTWTVTGTGANTVLTHSYTGGSSFSWRVCQASSTYTLVSTGGAVTITGATVKAGQVSCH